MDLYYMPISAPCRAVMLTAEAIGVPLNLKMIDLLTGKHLQPEYEQMNPQKTIPLLVDDDYKLTESRAIMGYLVDKYGKNGRLHPKDINTRALVNQRLHFDIGTLYKALSAYYYPVMFNGAREYDPDNYERLKSAFEILDKLLEGQDYSVGRSLTIADLSLAVSVSTAEAFGFEVRKYKNVTRWYDKVKNSAPGFRKINDEGIESLKKVIADVKNKQDDHRPLLHDPTSPSVRTVCRSCNLPNPKLASFGTWRKGLGTEFSEEERSMSAISRINDNDFYLLVNTFLLNEFARSI